MTKPSANFREVVPKISQAIAKNRKSQAILLIASSLLIIYRNSRLFLKVANGLVIN
ncbi:hypothetical protein HCG51_00245 [Tolypothrix sp. PCC 7910]|uniref:hypothetical protein n=1 Tax=Tolypothrix sp. PCC 7910 TaxID=2099387 RepID=UPI00142787D4|nr:hypothetical protein [Tolypothrix sp. PCC 7910]QIR35257.1 hypothetical protein HCG51_00245 [Tolypothrix sp. PCC 7910]